MSIHAKKKVLVVIAIVMLSLPALVTEVDGGSVMESGTDDFQNGTRQNLTVVKDTLRLDVDPALSDDWTKLLGPAFYITGRTQCDIVFDSVDAMFIIFGGHDGKRTLNETWTYDPATKEWANVTPDPSPPALNGHKMVYDPFNSKVVLFGGHNGTVRTNETWIFDPSTVTWTKMTTSKAPVSIPPSSAWSSTR